MGGDCDLNFQECILSNDQFTSWFLVALPLCLASGSALRVANCNFFRELVFIMFTGPRPAHRCPPANRFGNEEPCEFYRSAFQQVSAQMHAVACATN